MHRFVLGRVASLGLSLLLTSCSASTPAAPAPVTHNGFGSVNAVTTPDMTVDFAGCLAGASTPSCFSAPRASGRNAIASPATAPGAPINLTASSSSGNVTLTWAAQAGGDPPTSFIIEAGSAPGLTNLANFSTGNTLTIFQASGVGAGTYYVRVRATNASGASATSNEVVLVVGGSPGVAPGAPTGLTNTVNSGGTISFMWNAGSGSPTTYVIEAGSQSGSANLANIDLGSAATTMTATGVGAGTYYVRVRARNAFGTSGPSNEVVVTVGSPGCSPNLSPTAVDYVAGSSGCDRAGCLSTVCRRRRSRSSTNAPVISSAARRSRPLASTSSTIRSPSSRTAARNCEWYRTSGRSAMRSRHRA